MGILVKYLLNWLSFEEVNKLGEKVLMALRGESSAISSYLVVNMNRAILDNRQQHLKQTKALQANYTSLESKYNKLQQEVQEIKELLHFVMINKSVS